jgi:isopenicillin-N epimerase
MLEFGIPARRLFLLEPRTSFLNHGSFGAVPRPVLDAADQWRRRMDANPDRFIREILPGELRRAAERLAGHFHARGQDLVFVENATAGIDAVLGSLEFEPGDEILVSSHCYGAVRQAVRHACRRTGCRAIEVDLRLPLSSESDPFAPLAEALGERTKLLVIDHIASPTGLVFPVARLASLARSRGVRVLVDGAHAPGQLELDIPALGADWYVGNCHKWLFAARGCGFLWAGSDAQAGLHPVAVSHAYGQSFTAEFDWTGTRDFSGWLAIGAALDFVAEIGVTRMREHNHRLAIEIGERLARAWRTELDGPAPLHASMIGVRLPQRLQALGPPDGNTARRLMAQLLAEHDTVVAINPMSGALWARISAQIYNVAEDCERLARLGG